MSLHHWRARLREIAQRAARCALRASQTRVRAESTYTRGREFGRRPPFLKPCSMDRENVIDFVAARCRCRTGGCGLREHALAKCVEMYNGGDWHGFAYWHAVYLRERRRLAGPGID